MNYDDELERAQARRSRKRESGAGTSSSGSTRASRTSQSLGIQESAHTSAGSRGSHAGGASRTSGTGSTSRGTGTARTSYRRRKQKQQKMKRIILGVVLALVLVVGIGAFAAWRYIDGMWDSMQTEPFNAEEVTNPYISMEQKEKMKKGFWTVAIFGVDSRDNSLGKGNQSDVIMIANLNRETGEIKLVSVFRDTYLNVNDRNTYNKINAAYAAGGPEAAVKALNKNLDLNITHYATFNWKAVATVINILGGVEIDISPSEFYYINAFITETVKGTGIGSTQLPHAGVHNLDGVQAVAYGRLRLMDSDYARTERQRIVIAKAFEKVKTANLETLNSVVGHVFEMSMTNISFGDLAGLVKDVAKYHLGETTGFPAARGEAKIKIGSNRAACVIPQTLVSNVSSLHNFLYGEENYDPSPTVKEISNEIAYISGLSTEAEEIGHVAVDKGYIPKKTTEAAAENTGNDDESEEEGSEAEESSETLEGESESDESESADDDETIEESSEQLDPMNPSVPGPGYFDPPEDEPQAPGQSTRPTGNYMGPGNSAGPGSTQGSTEAPSGGPGSQNSGTSGSTTRPTAPNDRPGSEESPTRPTAPSTSQNNNSGGPGSQNNSTGTTGTPGGSANTGTSGGPGSQNTSPSGTTNRPTAPGSTTTSGPSSPADSGITSGGGPASQATSPANP